MGRQRGGGHREPMLHADAQRVLAEGDYPPRVKHTIWRWPSEIRLSRFFNLVR